MIGTMQTKIDSFESSLRKLIREKPGTLYLTPNADQSVDIILLRNCDVTKGVYRLNTTQFAFDIFCMAWDQQQAQIDALMLEHCPDDMTDEQWEEWGIHQREAKLQDLNTTTNTTNEEEN